MSAELTSGRICLDDKLVRVVCIEFWLISPLQSRSEVRFEGNLVFSSPLLLGQNRISALEGWTLRVASGVIVAAEKVEILPCGAGGEESWVESLLEDAVVALEREEREEKFHGGCGGKHRPFSFRDEDGDGSCAGRGLGELPNFEIKYFQ